MWFEEEIPFTKAATVGTQKVIRDHATIGVVGAILMTIFSLIPYFRIRHKRIKWVMMVFFLYDYFMYNATTCRDTYLVAMIFICIFSINYEYLKAKSERLRLEVRD